MKRLIALMLVLMTAFTGMQAKELNKEQMAIRLNIVKYLSREGYSPKIDSDGDVKFRVDDMDYYVIINEKWDDPYLVTLYLGFEYDEEYTKESMEHCISKVSQYKAVKLFCTDESYSYRVDIFCQNADVFISSFKMLMGCMKGAREDVVEAIKSGVADVDIVGHEDEAYQKALGYYDKDEDEKAFSLFKSLSDVGYKKAYRYVAFMAKYGIGTSKDNELMAKCLQKALDAGDMMYANELGLYYYDKGDYEKAMKYFLQCGSTDNVKRSTALYNVGYMYEKGLGVTEDKDKAIQFYRKSVKYATVLECDARKNLMRLGVTVEDKSEFVDATKTMLMGLNAEQMYTMGEEYEQGINNRLVSLPKAYAFYKAAADLDYTKAVAKMGDIYVNPYYPFNDKAKSDKYYQKAFKKYKQKVDGDGEACYNLGYMYEKGRGVGKDMEQAKFYYKSGAMKGDADAAWRFGLMCKEELEYADAFKYFYKAAEGEQSMAMYELAKLYEDGIGTTMSVDKAVEWYRKCVNAKCANSDSAEEALKRLGKSK